MSAQNNSPNINLFPLEKAENGIEQAIRALREISPGMDDQVEELQKICLDDLKDFQDGNLSALRRAIQ